MEAYAINDWDELEATYFGTAAGMDSYAPSYMGIENSGYAYQGAPALVPSVEAPERKRRRDRAAEQKAHLKALREFRRHEWQVTLKRLREMALVILCIAAVAGMFTFILLRQSQITSLNYKNHATEVAINDTLQETKQIQENLVAKTDLEQIRSEAMEKIGMQDPSARQVVSVVIPGSDQLVTNDFSSAEINSKVSLASAKANLAQYYSSLG